MRRLPLAVLLAGLAPLACDDSRPVPGPGPSSRSDATVTSSRADAAPLPGRDAAEPGSDAAIEDAAAPQRDGSIGGLDATSTSPDAGGPSSVEGIGIMRRMAGLWSGAGTGTRLGNFPRMVMDFRESDPKTLFGRVDLDANNALRMSFHVEDIGGKETLVFRNGGLFMGLSRDTRTVLIEADEARGHYRFCELQQGCAYNEATFDFGSADALVLDVTVRGQPHLHWTPTRQETRRLPDPFPAPGVVPGGAPFPPMPSLTATVRWSSPLTQPGDAWVILSTSDCSITACVVSRHHLGTAAAGATMATLTLDQVHPGTYKANAFIDRDRNYASTFSPGPGDGLSAPNAIVTIAPSGNTTWSGAILFDL